MKLDFIHQHPTKIAVDRYIQSKIQKKTSKGMTLSRAIEYLVQKKEAFLHACPSESRAEFAKSFDIRILKYKGPLFATALHQRIKNTFPFGITKDYSFMDNGNFYYDMTFGQDKIGAKWHVKQDLEGHIEVYISDLSADIPEQGQGIAVRFLKAIVEELQKTSDKDAKVKLIAASGKSKCGAYTWAQLGFETGDISKMQQALLRSLNPTMLKKMCKNSIFHYDALGFKSFCSNIHTILEESQKKIEAARHPWEIANIRVQGYPVGKWLMKNVSNSTYYGTLLPNKTDSESMQQFARRTVACKKRGFDEI